MKSSVLIGLVGGVVVGSLQFYSMMLSMETGPSTNFEMFLYYSPQIVYFMCIYMSVKLYVAQQTETVPSFKNCLKAGVISSVFISVICGIAFFIGLTHLDVALDVKQMIASGQGDKVRDFLSNVTRQNMFDRAQFWSIPNFLLGFAVTVLVTVIFRMRKKPMQY